MGFCLSKESKHFFHFFSDDFSQLHTYDCRSRDVQVSNFRKLDSEHTYFYQSISGLDGNIYVLGGKIVKEKEDKKEVPSDDGFVIETERIGDKKFLIKEGEKKNTEDIIIKTQKLPEPRCDHLLIADEGAILLLGGYVSGQKSKTCLRYNIEKGDFVKLPDLPHELDRACGLSIEGNIYVFDLKTESASAEPRIIVLNKGAKEWKEITYKDDAKTIKVFDHRAAFQIKEKQIYVVGENSEYIYDIEANEIRESQLALVVKDKFELNPEYRDYHIPGNRNFVNEDVVYDFKHNMLVEHNFHEKKKKASKLKWVWSSRLKSGDD